jgi:hypothetical protein
MCRGIHEYTQVIVETKPIRTGHFFSFFDMDGGNRVESLGKPKRRDIGDGGVTDNHPIDCQ